MKYIVITERSEKEYKRYDSAVSYAIAKGGTIFAVDGDGDPVQVPTIQVGNRYMFYNYEVVCTDIHADKVDLTYGSRYMPVNVMGISPMEIRECGSIESVRYYRDQMTLKLVDEQLSAPMAKRLLTKLEQNKTDDMTEEERCRVLGFILAVKKHIDNLEKGVIEF